MTRDDYLTPDEAAEVRRLHQQARLCDRASALYRWRPGQRDRAEQLYARARLLEAVAARIKADAYKRTVAARWAAFDPRQRLRVGR